MAWASMHFAVGMSLAGGGAAVCCLIRGRGWRWAPVASTLGGVWAMGPDLPRLFREDFPHLPLAGLLGHPAVDETLLRVGDLFFFHRALDAQPREFALHGLAIIIGLYNVYLAAALRGLSRRRRAEVAQPSRASEPPPPKTSAAASGATGAESRERSETSRAA
jgi:hypothetical protein